MPETVVYLGTEDGNILACENGDLIIVSALTGTVIGTTVTFLAAIIAAAGLAIGDRYFVCHYLDQTPEKFGRVVLNDGIWQGGDVFCDVSSAFPDSAGPFYLLYSGRSGTGITINHAWEQLAYDANVRRTS